MLKVFKNKIFISVFFGFLAASTFYLFLESRYEQKIQNAFIKSILNDRNTTNSNDNKIILAAMHLTHQQLKQNEIKSMGMQMSAFEQFFTSPLLQFALTKDGACGGNSLVLAQLLQGLGYDTRLAHMKANGVYGGHIVLEVNCNNNWIVLDPLYNLSFKNKEGSLASFNEVSNNWSYFQNQVPLNYDNNYKYEGVQYTNWNKIPVIGTFAKSFVGLFLGKDASEHFSFRKYFLQPKKMLFYLSIYLLGFSIFVLLNKRYIHFSFSLKSMFFNLKQHRLSSI